MRIPKGYLILKKDLIIKLKKDTIIPDSQDGLWINDLKATDNQKRNWLLYGTLEYLKEYIPPKNAV